MGSSANPWAVVGQDRATTPPATAPATTNASGATSGWEVVHQAPASAPGLTDALTGYHPPSATASPLQDVSEFARGFNRGTVNNLNPVNVAKSLYQSGQQPGSSMFLPAPVNMYIQDSRARGPILDQATKEFHQGHYLDALVHGGASMVPFLGSSIASGWDALNQGDYNKLGESVGNVAAMKTVPEAYGGLVRGGVKAYNKAASNISIPPAPKTEAALNSEAVGIPNLPDETTARWGPRVIRRFLANKASSRPAIYNAMADQNLATQQAGANVADKMGGGYTPAESGSAVNRILAGQDQSKLQSAIDAEHDRVTGLNDAATAEANRTNLDNEAGVRGPATYQNDLQTQRLGAQADALGGIRDTVGRFGDAQPHDVVGDAANTALDANYQTFRNHAANLYNRVDELTGGDKAPVDIQPAIDFMTKLGKDVQGTAGVGLKSPDIQQIVADSDRWSQFPNTVSFNEAADVLSALKSIGRQYPELMKGRYAGNVNRVVNLLDQQMQDSATQAGPEALAAYREANNFYRAGAQTFKESAVNDWFKRDPEQISQKLWNPKSITAIRETKAALTGQPEAWRALQRRGLEDLFEKSMRDGKIDPGALKTNWNALGESVQREMAEGSRDQLNDQISHYHLASAPLDFESPPTAKTVTPKLATASVPKLEATPQGHALRDIANRHPESLASHLLSPQSEGLWDELHGATRSEPDVYDSVRRQGWEQLMRENTRPTATGGMDVIDGKRFAEKWKALGPAVQSRLAGAQLPDINRFISAISNRDLTKLDSMRNAIYGGVGGHMATGLGVLGALGGLELHSPVAAVLSLGTSALYHVGPHILARAFLSPGGAKWLTEGLSIPKASPEAGQWLARGAAYMNVAATNSNQRKSNGQTQSR